MFVMVLFLVTVFLIVVIVNGYLFNEVMVPTHHRIRAASTPVDNRLAIRAEFWIL